MRIVNKTFHDYYDSVMIHGVDESLTYVRKNQERYFEDPYRFNDPEHKDHFLRTVQLSSLGNRKFCGVIFSYSILLGFAGKVYPAVSVDHNYAYNVKDFNTLLEENDIKKDKKTPSMFISHGAPTGAGWPEWFFSHPRREAVDLFDKYNAPIFVVRGKDDYQAYPYTIELNPCLREYQFYKVKDAYTAYQELYQYLAAKTSPEKEILPVDDKYKIQQRGFNKWSFRKPPKENR